MLVVVFIIIRIPAESYVNVVVKYSGGEAYANAGVRVIDVRSFAGNSGSPVFRESGFEEAPLLLGVISAGDDDLDFAVAEPVSRVIEALEFAAERTPPAQASWVAEQ